MRYQLRIRSFKQCQETTEAFVSCSEGRLFSTTWACREQLNSLNQCTKSQYASEASCDRPHFLQRLMPHMLAEADLVVENPLQVVTQL